MQKDFVLRPHKSLFTLINWIKAGANIPYFFFKETDIETEKSIFLHYYCVGRYFENNTAKFRKGRTQDDIRTSKCYIVKDFSLDFPWTLVTWWLFPIIQWDLQNYKLACLNVKLWKWLFPQSQNHVIVKYSTLEVVIGSNALTWVIWSSIGGAKIKSQKENETGQRDWSNVCLFQTHVQSNPFSIDVVELELIVNIHYLIGSWEIHRMYLFVCI